MSTLWPLTLKWPCTTSWRAWRRVGGEPGAVDDVGEAALEQLQQVVTGLAGAAGGLGVVVVELLLEDAVGVAGLLLLPQLEEVLALLDAAAAVLAGRVGTTLVRRVAAHQVHA